MKFLDDRLTWRFAHESDCKLYFQWANEASVRSNAHQQSLIPWETHEKWFRSRLSSESLMLIFFYDGTPVGQVRIDKEGNAGIMDYSVDKSYRGKDIATAMINIVKTMFDKTRSGLSLSAIVKTENVPSVKVLQNCGFTRHRTIDISGVACYVYEFHF